MMNESLKKLEEIKLMLLGLGANFERKLYSSMAEIIALEKGSWLSDIDESGVASRIPIRYSYDIKNSFLFVLIFLILYQIFQK